MLLSKERAHSRFEVGPRGQEQALERNLASKLPEARFVGSGRLAEVSVWKIHVDAAVINPFPFHA